MAEISVIPAKNRSDEVVRIAAYTRVSSDSEDQLNSFAAQIRYYTELLSNSTDSVFVDIPEEAEVVKEIYRCYLDGMSIDMIADRMNNKGLLTKWMLI